MHDEQNPWGHSRGTDPLPRRHKDDHMDRGRPAHSDESGHRRFVNTPGPYTGVGPKGYQRSDEAICREVCEFMAGHGQLDASEIEVRVENSEVILEGTVPDRWSKRLAEDLAESAFGVQDVHNRLRITQPPRGDASQPDLRRDVNP